MTSRRQGESEFVTLAAHELRSPVVAINEIAKTLAGHTDTLEAGEVAALHQLLLRNTELLTRLLDELLDLSRADAGGITIAAVPLAVRGRVEELVDALGGDRGGEVTVDVPEELSSLVDPGAFDRIVGNLIANALLHGRPPVTITARASDEVLNVVVEDRGDGVPAEFAPRLFDRFARGPRPAGDTSRGSGLGLAIAQLYAQAHGGALTYHDASPRGARFELELPTP
jgi:two-component system, OmpR family, sensor histidine kinase MtrB